jgi:hypothetical protein
VLASKLARPEGSDAFSWQRMSHPIALDVDESLFPIRLCALSALKFDRRFANCRYE